MNHTFDKLDRASSSLICFAIGDALGATTEFMTPKEIKEEIGVQSEITGGGWLCLEPGQVTDDTEMALCIARSLVACGCFDMTDIAARLVEWYNNDPVDIGSTCRAGIHRHIRTGTLETPYNHEGAGNGGVMRALPLILCYAHDPQHMHECVLTQSRLTHNNRESDLGCRCYAELVAAAVTGADKMQLAEIAARYPLFSGDKFDGKAGGYIVETMRTVLHHFFKAESLEECLIGVVNCGHDADTNGALAGGLAGAFWGTAALPLRWIEALDRDVHNELQELAGRLNCMRREP